LGTTERTQTMSTRCDSVRRYFHEAIDGRSPEIILELFTPDCRIHRPEIELEGARSLAGLIKKLLPNYKNFQTEIHAMIESGDMVAVRLTHRAVSTGPFVSRVGVYDVSGKPIEWQAMAMFRFEGDSIAEEWVNRDELGMLLHYDLISLGSDPVMRAAPAK